MFVEKKIINGKLYYYLKHSFRSGNKIKTKTLAYIGNKKNKEKIIKIKKQFSSNELGKIKKELFGETDWNLLLSEKDKERNKEIKKGFSLKLEKFDTMTKKEMFDDFLTYFIYNSNAIEGNTLTLRETDLLLNKGITPQGKTLREINDHLNSRQVFYYLLNENPKINAEMVVFVHDKLLENIDGRKGYRNSNVRVIGAAFKSSLFQYIKTDMNLLIKWYNKNRNKLHPLILASLFHHKFEKIHPFYDGNGRTGRMLMNFILIKNKIPPVILSSKQRKKYYEVLSKADKTNLTEITEDFKPLVKFISTQILKTWNTLFKQWG